MDIELIGQEIKKAEFELSKIEEERYRLIEKLDDMRQKVTVYTVSTFIPMLLKSL